MCFELKETGRSIWIWNNLCIPVYICFNLQKNNESRMIMPAQEGLESFECENKPRMDLLRILRNIFGEVCPVSG